MKRNIELLTKVRDLIQTQPEKLDMASWGTVPLAEVGVLEDGQRVKVSCGTTACIAGWAAQLSGDQLLVSEWDRSGDEYHIDDVVAKNGRTIHVHKRGQKLLGLTPDEADWLFLEVNNDGAVAALNRLINGDDVSDEPGFYVS